MKHRLFLLSIALITSLIVSCQKNNENVTKFTFENDVQGWSALPDANVSITKDAIHEGTSSLKIEGTVQSGLWSIAQSGRIHLQPGKKYYFSGWMKVDSLSDGFSFFKFILYRDSKWVKSINSEYYNMYNKEKWQHLNGEVVAPDNGESFINIAVEKRPQEKSVYGIIEIDDITFTITE